MDCAIRFLGMRQVVHLVWRTLIGCAGFFQVLCIDHLMEKLPAVSEFLALPPGYRFLTNGIYQDVWFDGGLLQV